MFALVLLLSMASVALAHPCKPGPRRDPCATKCNPDGRTSITLTGGMGNLDGRASADLTTLGVALVYPTTRNVSLLARYDHAKAEWDGAPRYVWPTSSDFSTDLYTVGIRFYLGR